MAGSFFRSVVVLALVGLLLGAGGAQACPFCTMQGQTLTDEVKQASMVLYGTLTNAKTAGNADSFDGTTDLKIEKVIKSHEILGDREVLTLNRYIPPTGGEEYRFLVFCDVFKGRIDPYRGIAVKADCDMPRYLAGALKVKDASASERLLYFFDFLDNEDLEISTDAYREFSNEPDYGAFKQAATKFPITRVIGWLKDSSTPGFRIGLYASMLGHGGKPENASILLGLLEDPEKRASSGVDGILAGYTLLKPREGLAYLRDVLSDPKKDFLTRYAALRALRFFWENRTDVLSQDQIADAVALLLEQKDIADLAIEDLRKWKRWDLAGTIVGLSAKEPYKVPIVRRAILRYALSCPADVAPAQKFLQEQRKSDPQAVLDAEELLKLEQPSGKS